MTTAQSPVDVLRAALKLVASSPPWTAANALQEFAREKLREAAALAAEVQDERCAHCGEPYPPAAPPPAPVPGGMLRAKAEWQLLDSVVEIEAERLSYGLKGDDTFYDLLSRLVKTAFEAGARAAATPPEVVVGMPADVSWTLNKPRGETRPTPAAEPQGGARDMPCSCRLPKGNKWGCAGGGMEPCSCRCHRTPAPDPKPTVCGKPYGYEGETEHVPALACQREPNHEGPCGGTGTGTERAAK